MLKNILLLLALTVPVTPKQATDGLIAAGGKYPGAHVCESQPHANLMILAQDHAERQAEAGKPGHIGFKLPGHQAWLQKNVGNYSFNEISSAYWSTQQLSGYDLGWQAFACWRTSPPHWSVACRKHKYYGAGYAKDKNGGWYATILTAD